MCFGGNTPSPPDNPASAPVDTITAGQPTITASPTGTSTAANPATNPAAVAPRTATSPPVQGQASSGLSNLGI